MGGCPRLLPPSPPPLALQTAEKGRLTAKGRHRRPLRDRGVEPKRGGLLCGPRRTDHTDEVRVGFLCWGVGASSEAVKTRTSPAPGRRSGRLSAWVLGFKFRRVPWGVASRPAVWLLRPSLVVVPGLAGLSGWGAAGLRSGPEATVLSPKLQVVRAPGDQGGNGGNRVTG